MPTPCLWTARVWAEFRAGNLTRHLRDVLLTFRGHSGASWPSHATLANRAKCSVKTVQRALKQGDHLGLVSWIERRVRAGWRLLRTSNSYHFRLLKRQSRRPCVYRAAEFHPLSDSGSA
jgi:DNA-binding transcriptional MocR family regulator